MARIAEMIHILRRTLIDLEELEHPDDPTVQELKRSILRSIAQMETWRDSEPGPSHQSCTPLD
jgi:hypothetical protein